MNSLVRSVARSIGRVGVRVFSRTLPRAVTAGVLVGSGVTADVPSTSQIIVDEEVIEAGIPTGSAALDKAIKDGYPYKIVDLRGKLEVHKTRIYQKRPLDAIDMHVDHHAAVTGIVPRSIAHFHVYEKGWAGPGYHACIDAEGTLFILNDDETWSFHASGHNFHSLGTVYLGNYEVEEPTHEMMVARKWLADAIKEAYGVTCFVLHRDLKATLCPGSKLVPVLREITLDTCTVL